MTDQPKPLAVHDIGALSDARRRVISVDDGRAFQHLYAWACKGCGRWFDVSVTVPAGEPQPLGPTPEQWREAMGKATVACPGKVVDQPKPPGPADTPYPVCGNADGPYLGSGFGHANCTRPAGHAGNHVNDREYTRHEWAQIPGRPEPAAPADSVPVILSRPTIGEHRDGKMVDCPVCAPALPPDARHPAPWRWEGIEVLYREGRPQYTTPSTPNPWLADAKGGVVAALAVGSDAGPGTRWYPYPGPGLRELELLRAAPEMEALLREETKGTVCIMVPREAVGRREIKPEEMCPTDAPCWWCRVRELLARIDAAKGGDRG